jgi:cold-inducible RNA-binding protein
VLDEREEAVISTRVFVGNVSYETSQKELEELFATAGSVVEVFMPADRDTGRPRGFAFVEFSDEAGVAEAIEKFNDYAIGGRNLRVNVAEERRPRPAPAVNRGWTDAPPKDDWGAKPKGSRRNIRGRKRSL